MKAHPSTVWYFLHTLIIDIDHWFRYTNRVIISLRLVVFVSGLGQCLIELWRVFHRFWKLSAEFLLDFRSRRWHAFEWPVTTRHWWVRLMASCWKVYCAQCANWSRFWMEPRVVTIVKFWRMRFESRGRKLSAVWNSIRKLFIIIILEVDEQCEFNRRISANLEFLFPFIHFLGWIIMKLLQK